MSRSYPSRLRLQFQAFNPSTQSHIPSARQQRRWQPTRTKQRYIKPLTAKTVSATERDARLAFLTWRDDPKARRASLLTLWKQRDGAA